MTQNLSKALARTRTVYTNAYLEGGRLKQAGLLDLAPSSSLGFGDFASQTNNKRRYQNYRGWVYAAINALASEGAGQPIQVGRLKKTKEKEPKGRKSYIKEKMPLGLRTKTADEEMELLPDHFLLKKLEKPNPIQHAWQFTYSFISNLCLTGWSFVFGGEIEGQDGVEFYSLPTSWVTPIHKKGAFAEFRVADPNNPQAQYDDNNIFSAENVAFAYLPDPSNPLAALAPAAAQNAAITIDDNIQRSQAVFFDNMIAPSALVTVGKNPHPDVPGGVRPRLTAPQRRQVHAAIRKLMSGTTNYGNPAIIDGMIESITRLDPSQNEIGWEKSEKTVRTRILSAFAVHPFILGEEMAGSYAQAYIVQDRFCKRVNTYLGMLSTVMTYFAGPIAAIEDDLMVWWEECVPKDPSMEKQLWEGARGRDDISQDEFRAYMGLPPDEDKQQSFINKSSIQAITAVAKEVHAGGIDPEQGRAILEGSGIPSDLATRIAGKPAPQPMQPNTPGAPGVPQQPANGLQNTQQKPQPGQQTPPKPSTPKEELQKAVNQFENLLGVVRKTPEEWAEDVINHSRLLLKGGAGSGNFNHAGRPGKVGGSAGKPSGGESLGFVGQWKPMMSREEADEWSKNSVWKGEVYHSAPSHLIEQYKDEGFAYGGGLYGRGIYTSNQKSDNSVESFQGSGSSKVGCRVNVRKVLDLDMRGGISQASERPGYKEWERITEGGAGSESDKHRLALIDAGYDAIHIRRGNDDWLLVLDKKSITIVDESKKASHSQR